jgi:citronellol/citronellal dehydrogenase
MVAARNPGELHRTGMRRDGGLRRLSPEGAATYWEANPQRHPGDPWDVAEACVYLLAPSGKFITGEVLTVDGGQQMWGNPWPTGRPDWARLS